MRPKHPYSALESLPSWPVLERALGDLVENGDLEERTQRAYLVGYLCKALKDAGVLLPKRVTKKG